MMRVALSKAVPVSWPRQKGMFLFALLFVLVAVCSLSFYYAQLGLTPAPVASSGYRGSGEETAAVNEETMPPGAAEPFRGGPGTVVGLE